MVFQNPFVSRSKKLDEARRKSAICVGRIMADHRKIIEASRRDGRPVVEGVISTMALQSFCDQVAYTDDAVQGAALALDYIVQFHLFADGNKRTAVATALRLLNSAGLTLPNGAKLANFVKEVAMGRYTRSEIEEWIRRNAVSLRAV